MITITEELKKFADQYFDITGLTTTPFWKDECGHEAGSYICSFIVNTTHGSKIYEHKYDMYVFNQGCHGQELCLRGGPKPGDYCSPGSVTDFLIRNKLGRRWQRGVADLLTHVGRIKWEQTK